MRICLRGELISNGEDQDCGGGEITLADYFERLSGGHVNRKYGDGDMQRSREMSRIIQATGLYLPPEVAIFTCVDLIRSNWTHSGVVMVVSKVGVVSIRESHTL